MPVASTSARTRLPVQYSRGSCGGWSCVASVASGRMSCSCVGFLASATARGGDGRCCGAGWHCPLCMRAYRRRRVVYVRATGVKLPTRVKRGRRVCEMTHCTWRKGARTEDRGVTCVVCVRPKRGTSRHRVLRAYTLVIHERERVPHKTHRQSIGGQLPSSKSDEFFEPTHFTSRSIHNPPGRRRRRRGSNPVQ